MLAQEYRQCLVAFENRTRLKSLWLVVLFIVELSHKQGNYLSRAKIMRGSRAKMLLF